jgi:hypothetical protein
MYSHRSIILFSIIFLFFSSFSSAQIVEDVVITDTDKGYDIEMKFFVPLHYQSHYPKKPGDTFEVSMRPENFADPSLEDGLTGAGSVSWDKSRGVPLGEIIFDGEMPNSPKIIARFIKDVKFSVRNSANLRSLYISIDTTDSPKDIVAKKP